MMRAEIEVSEQLEVCCQKSLGQVEEGCYSQLIYDQNHAKQACFAAGPTLL
jgi:hypothetical protein